MIETDEISDRSPSIVLDAITLEPNNQNLESFSLSLALKVPKFLPEKM